MRPKTPAAVITLATAVSDIQPILFGTQICATDINKSRWTVRAVDVIINADNWNINRARVTLTVPDAPGLLPALPDVSKYRGGRYPYLSEEDEIRIYMGMVGSDKQVLDISNLSDIPFPIPYTDMKPKEGATLFPVFWGFIEKVEVTADANTGVQVVLSCQDRMRLLHNTRVLSNPDTLFSAPTPEQKGDRALILRKILNFAVGYSPIETESGPQVASCWKEFKEGMTVRGYDIGADGKIEYLFANKLIAGDASNSEVKIIQDMNKLTPGEELVDAPRWTRAAMFTPMSPGGNPRTHIWLQRPPIEQGQNRGVFNFINESPADIIQAAFLLKEERVVDASFSHINGDFIIAPNSGDTSGFQDPNRLYRTYFFRSLPAGLNICPDERQRILSMRVVSSSIATTNRFIVTDDGGNGASDSFNDAIEVTLQATPYKYANRNPPIACRATVVEDKNLSAYTDAGISKETGALLVGLGMARRTSRDISTIQITIIGDPTWYPNEMFQVYNTLIHDRQIISAYDSIAEESTMHATKKELSELSARMREHVASSPSARAVPFPDGSDILTRYVGAHVNATDPNYDDPNSGRIVSNVDANLANAVLPKYKVRSIRHKLTHRDYTTTIQGSAD